MKSASQVQAIVDQVKQEMSQNKISSSMACWRVALACVGWPYTYGARGGKTTKDGISVRTFDCRGFTYWVLLQIFGWKLVGVGCTSQWNNEDNWLQKGEISDGIPQNVIVCLFYYKKENGKRTKTLEHTGFYYNGETCECSKGVQHSKTLNKKWEVWGIPKCVSEIPPQPEKPVLRKGSSGSYVTLLQAALIQRGYALPKYGADGKFGNETLSAVEAFQRDHGLASNGIVDAKTWEALDSDSKKSYTVLVKNVSRSVAESIVNQYGGVITAEDVM